MTTIALFGAAGKMGTRIANKLKNEPEYKMLYVEADEARLREHGFEPTAKDKALKIADVIILAVPDALIGQIANDVVPSLKSGAMLICLDPAAPHAGEMPDRKDVSYFVVHPCHPPLFNDETDPEAKADLFGGFKAKQNIVCSLMQGPEEDYFKGEQISRKMFGPVMTAHRITVEQMAMLEPAMTETLELTCMYVIKEAMEEVIRQGVPAQAAKDFLMGHLSASIAIMFGFIDAQVSDGARLAAQRAKSQIFQPDWKKVLAPENVMEQVKAITQGN